MKSILLLLITTGLVQNAFAHSCKSKDLVIAITSGKIEFAKSAAFDSAYNMAFSAGEEKTDDSWLSGRYVYVSSFQTGQSGKTMFIRSVGVSGRELSPTLEIGNSLENFKQGAALGEGSYFGVIYFRGAKLNPRPDSIMNIGSLKYNLGKHARLSDLECRDISQEEFAEIYRNGNASFRGLK